MGKHKYILNAWYVAALSSELVGEILSRRILDIPLVLYRTESGAPAALLDRCPHREAPLSLGYLSGENIVCGYHGMAFQPDGSCCDIPGQDQIPDDARVTSYKLIEKWGWVFVWMGDAAKADETLLPDFFYTEDAGWTSQSTRLPVKCSYQLLVDNLLDLTHLTYLHTDTIGQQQVIETPGKTTRTEDGVQIARWVLSSPAPSFWAKTRGLSGTVDRWSISKFSPPSYVVIETGGAPEHSGAERGDYSQASLQMVLNGITPETATSCHYFWATALDYAPDNPDITREAFKQLYHVLLEDVVMLEAQQAVIDQQLDDTVIDRKHDSASMEARRITDRLATVERANTDAAI